MVLCLRFYWRKNLIWRGEKFWRSGRRNRSLMLLCSPPCTTLISSLFFVVFAQCFPARVTSKGMVSISSICRSAGFQGGGGGKAFGIYVTGNLIFDIKLFIKKLRQFYAISVESQPPVSRKWPKSLKCPFLMILT